MTPRQKIIIKVLPYLEKERQWAIKSTYGDNKVDDISAADFVEYLWDKFLRKEDKNT